LPPIITVGAPGPMIVPPWLVVSPTQAAAGIALSFIRLGKPCFNPFALSLSKGIPAKSRASTGLS
jgi:hypothetical protein